MTVTLTREEQIIELCVFYGTDPRIWRTMDQPALDKAWRYILSRIN